MLAIREEAQVAELGGGGEEEGEGGEFDSIFMILYCHMSEYFSNLMLLLFKMIFCFVFMVSLSAARVCI